MAETLLFRGGPSNDITASTVQSREIVIDTDTDQIVSGPSRKKTVMEDNNGNISIDGDVLIGGTLPSAPNITLASSGNITAGTFNLLKIGRGGGGISTNTVVGTGALPANTTGNNNSALGRIALNANTEGSSNNAFGRGALYSNTEGISNNALGNNALYNNTTGLDNTAIGRNALLTNTEGDNNTAVGNSSLRNNTTGANNTALGQNAGYYIKGSNNTILGAYQGGAADSTLSDTVIISAGATERARCDSNGDWDFGSIILKSPNGLSLIHI